MSWEILQSIERKILTKAKLLETYVHLRNGWRQLFLEIKIDLRHRAACKHVTNILKSVQPLNLKFGGGQKKAGWINVDLFNSTSDLTLDLRRALPFPDVCIDNIYLDHVLERFNHPDTLRAFLKECFRILKLDGVIHAAVTDFGRAFKLYAQGDEEGFYIWKYGNDNNSIWSMEPMDELNQSIYEDGKYHFMFDKENLINYLVRGGFSNAHLREYEPSLDSEERRHQSLYVKAVKETNHLLCDTVFDELQANNADVYNELWTNEGISRLYANPSRRLIWRQLAKIAAEIDGPVLDIGCGDGRLLALLAKQNGRKIGDLYGVDYSGEAIKHAQRRISGANLLQSDIHCLNFPDNYFGVVIASETLEHALNPSTVLKEGYRVLKPEGRLIITIPNGDIDDWQGHSHFWNEAQFREFSREYPLIRFELLEQGHTLLFVFEK
jgi:ubiquinone/menaquinone biosynthesis C-methylase UbiE